MTRRDDRKQTGRKKGKPLCCGDPTLTLNIAVSKGTQAAPVVWHNTDTVGSAMQVPHLTFPWRLQASAGLTNSTERVIVSDRSDDRLHQCV